MNKKEAIRSALKNARSYLDYISLIENLHLKEKASSFQNDRKYYDFSVLNLSRMNRVYKRVELDSRLVEVVSAIHKRQTWLLITESWCGDAAQSVPIIARLAEQSEHVDLCIILRDSEPELMQHYLTNGGMSIPILAVLDIELNELMRWGPRPMMAQQKVIDYKSLPETRPPYEDLSIELQKWYNTDKGHTTQTELIELFNSAN